MSYDKTDALKYIDILQSCITRMANNSAKCKTWCVTIIAAIIAFFIDNTTNDVSFLIFVPILSLWFLDAFYLYLEKEFRLIYDNYMKEYDGKNIPDSTYKIDSKTFAKCKICNTLRQACSVSVFSFYGILSVVLLIAIKLNCISCLFCK